MNYDLKLINDYINAEDIHEYSLEELENNPKFMESVIRVSNDKNFYDLCSIEVKNDYEFVQFMIDKFNYDLSFVDKVATIYLGNCNDEFSKISVIVKMCNISRTGNDSDIFAKYRIMFMARFYSDLTSIESYKNENPDDNDIGLGFLVFYEDYNYDIDVLKSYSKELINYLLNELGADFESEIHKDFKSRSDINNYGVNKYIIEFLSRYDHYLADYAAVHIDVLDEIKQKLNKIQIKWDKYIDKEEAYTYELMFSQIHDYMTENALDSIISEDEYIYYIGKELGLSDKIAFYSCMDIETYEEINKDVDEDFIKKSLKNAREKIIYSNVKKIMINSLFNNEPNQNNEKIIRVDFGKSRK